jgi:DNA-binding transcriptional MocR family regulator
MRTVSARSVGLLLGPEPLSRPAYRSLTDAIRRLISDGRILVGTRLPSERALVSELRLSRTTVGGAFEALREEGFVVTRRGSGSVAALPAGPSGLATSSAGLMPADLPDDVIDLTYAALPAASGVTAAYERALADLPRHLASSGYNPHGLPEARQAIADWYEGRGLPTDPNHVVVTCGAHAGLSSVLRALLDPGDRVLVESPTYPNALVGVRRSGLRPLAHPIDPLGWDAESLGLALRQGGARMAYLVPDFQNPTGRLMTAAERVAVAAALRMARTQPIIDETFVELGLDTQPPAPFAASSPDAITLGSAGKTFWGGLRVGWVRAPGPLVSPILEARHSLDLGTAVLEQLVLIELLRAGEPVLAERRAEAKLRRDALVTALRTYVPDWRFRVPEGGLNLWCELPVERGDALARAAESVGLRLARGSQFGVGPGMDRFVRVPYSRPADESEELGQRLAEAWQLALGSRSTGEPTTPLIA